MNFHIFTIVNIDKINLKNKELFFILSKKEYKEFLLSKKKRSL